MRTAVLALLTVVAVLQFKTSVALAGRITDAFTRGLDAVELHAAASAVQHPARMVRLVRGEAGKAASAEEMGDDAAFTPARWSLQGSPARLRLTEEPARAPPSAPERS